MAELEDHYATLGVSPDASTEEIQRSLKALLKQYHPDRNPHGAERTTTVNQAWNVLGRPTSRAAYDRERELRITHEPEEPEPTLGTWGWGEVVDDPPPPPQWQQPPPQWQQPPPHWQQPPPHWQQQPPPPPPMFTWSVPPPTRPKSAVTNALDAVAAAVDGLIESLGAALDQRVAEPLRGRRRTSARPAFHRPAVVAFVCAVFGMSAFGVVLGPVALWQGIGAYQDVRDSPQPLRGRRLAMWAVGLGAVETVVIYASLIASLGGG